MPPASLSTLAVMNPGPRMERINSSRSKTMRRRRRITSPTVRVGRVLHGMLTLLKASGIQTNQCARLPQQKTPRILLIFQSQYQVGFFGQITLAPEPILHRFAQLVQRNFSADFHDSIRHRQGVIEDGRIGEVPHGKVVQPLQWTSQPSALLFIFNEYFPGKHKKDLNT